MSLKLEDKAKLWPILNKVDIVKFLLALNDSCLNKSGRFNFESSRWVSLTTFYTSFNKGQTKKELKLMIFQNSTLIRRQVIKILNFYVELSKFLIIPMSRQEIILSSRKLNFLQKDSNVLVVLRNLGIMDQDLTLEYLENLNLEISQDQDIYNSRVKKMGKFGKLMMALDHIAMLYCSGGCESSIDKAIKNWKYNNLLRINMNERILRSGLVEIASGIPQRTLVFILLSFLTRNERNNLEGFLKSINLEFNQIMNQSLDEKEIKALLS